MEELRAQIGTNVMCVSERQMSLGICEKAFLLRDGYFHRLIARARKEVNLVGSVYFVVKNYAQPKSERKRRKSENNTTSNYPIVRKSEIFKQLL